MSKKDEFGKIGIALNGGEPTMDSATIPIRWWLSKKAIELGARYLVFFEQTEVEKETFYYANDKGRRHICKIEDGCKYIQLFSPGYHRIMVVAIGGENDKLARRHAMRYLDKKNDTYNLSMNWEEMENLSYLNHYGYNVVAGTIVEFDVPKELFAEKPQTKRSEAVWRWTNYWYKTKPRDECEYRKRMIVAFTVQIPIIIMMVISKLIAVPIASLVMLFVGYRPKPILKGMWSIITLNSIYNSWDVRRYSHDDLDSPPCDQNIRGLWSYEKIGDKRVCKRMPITPLGAFLFTCLGSVIVIVFKAFTLWQITKTIIAIIIAIAIIAAASVLSHGVAHKGDDFEAKMEKRRKEEEIAHKEWLLKNFALSKKTKKVDLNKLPVPIGRKDRVVQKFYVGFWQLKNRVCKPFAK